MFHLAPSPAPVTAFYFSSQQIRAITIDGSPWFVGKDVANALGYTDTVNALKQHCKGVVKRHPLQTPGGAQEIRLIAQPDLCRLVANSKLPAAERFERWIFEEVLPSIIRTGTYSIPQAQPRQESRQLQGPVVSVLQYGERPIRIVHREDGAWIAARDAVPAMGYKGGVTLITQRLPRGEAQTIDVGPCAAVARRLIVLNGAGISRLANRGTKPTAKAFGDWLNSQGLDIAHGPSSQQLPLQPMPSLTALMAKPRLTRVERFQVDQKSQMRADAQCAKVLLKEIEKSNRRIGEITGDFDVHATASLLKNAILNTDNFHGLMLGLADYLCRSLDGTQTDLDEWEVLDGVL